jgi:hypothetical protein
MDAWTLAYLAGDHDTNIVERHGHPRAHAIREAKEIRLSEL